jgi:hypothetical protein
MPACYPRTDTSLPPPRPKTPPPRLLFDTTKHSPSATSCCHWVCLQYGLSSSGSRLFAYGMSLGAHTCGQSVCGCVLFFSFKEILNAGCAIPNALCLHQEHQRRSGTCVLCTFMPDYAGDKPFWWIGSGIRLTEVARRGCDLSVTVNVG